MVLVSYFLNKEYFDFLDLTIILFLKRKSLLSGFVVEG